MKKTVLLSLCAIFCSYLAAQTNLSGVINRYAAVTDINACAGTLTVEDASDFAADTDIFIVQMQGAIINTANNASFGDIENLRNAGRYEQTRIRAIIGNTIELANALLNTYDLDGSVQIVSLPVFDNAIITDTLTAQPWNGRSGGIVALHVTNTLTFEAPIDVSGKGFRGGGATIGGSNNCNFLLSQNNYFYELGNWRGAAKGEGIAAFILGREAGRGAQATGGGGGNDHNAGGGGGANTTPGGRGGNNQEPSTFGCDGRFPGIGGKAPAEATQRIFLGGGGGAGHENNNVATPGGQGGGMVILIANQINGTTPVITANGESVRTTTGDGAGGGGAGGTILLDFQNMDNPILLQANGGNGGDVDNRNTERCHGPGGGGSGGQVRFPQNAMIGFSVSRGEAGQSVNSAACTDSTNGAMPGEDGSNDVFQGIPQSTEPNTGAIIAISEQPLTVSACSDAPATIAVSATGADLTYQWQIDRGDGNGWQNLNADGIFSGVQTSELRISGVSDAITNATFRLEVSSVCATQPVLSLPIQIELQPAVTAQFDFSADGLNVQFTHGATNARSYFWDFGDGNTDTLPNPVHTYAAAGEYTITLTASGRCDTVSVSRMIILQTLPQANFDLSVRTGCAPLSVTFNNTSSDNAVSFAWIFPGGTPSTATQRNPTVTYNTPGTYNATLIASNANGVDTFVLENAVTVQQTPTAAFLATANDLTVVFTNNAAQADTYSWNFGDGNTSNEANPTHMYAMPGNYIVTLTVRNNCGEASVNQMITAGLLPSARFSQNRQNGCAPLVVTFRDESMGTYTTRTWTFPGGNPGSSTEAEPTVRYESPGQYDVMLTIDGVLGSSTITETAYINVLPLPTAAFSFTNSGNTVQFTSNAMDATGLLWNFGDGNTSTATNPTHTYATSGIYEVTLNASNAYCGRSTSRTVAVGLTSLSDLRQQGIAVFPNPVQETLFVQHQNAAERWTYRLYSFNGQLLKTDTFSREAAIDVSAFAKGMYLLQLQNSTHIWVVRIVKG